MLQHKVSAIHDVRLIWYVHRTQQYNPCCVWKSCCFPGIFHPAAVLFEISAVSRVKQADRSVRLFAGYFAPKSRGQLRSEVLPEIWGPNSRCVVWDKQKRTKRSMDRLKEFSKERVQQKNTIVVGSPYAWF